MSNEIGRKGRGKSQVWELCEIPKNILELKFGWKGCLGDLGVIMRITFWDQSSGCGKFAGSCENVRGSCVSRKGSVLLTFLATISFWRIRLHALLLES